MRTVQLTILVKKILLIFLKVTKEDIDFAILHVYFSSPEC